ncbi:MAG: hypothetical protein J0L82_19420 [Deltaproteobacteria bacterium]|nr:hypothetical protein [Deltaproteobacteria bacterium]
MNIAALLPEGRVTVGKGLKWMEEQGELWLSQLNAQAREFHRKEMHLISAVGKSDLGTIQTLVNSGVEVNQRYGRPGS